MAHIHELIDYTTDVMIVYQNKVLLRKHDKYNIWLGVGGHIELDEDPVTAAKREVKEEVGLDITIFGEDKMPRWSTDRVEIVPPAFLNMHPINKTHTHISFIYFGIADSDRVVPENKSDEWHWFTKKEIENCTDINPDIKHYAIEALRAASH